MRIPFLIECLRSIRSAGCETIYVVGPKLKLEATPGLKELVTSIIDDPGTGLTDAINICINSFPETIRYVGWLGDDDLLSDYSLINSMELFESNQEIVATYGACTYIDKNGVEIFTNKSGQWASAYMNFLPNLIPQPGSIYSREAYNLVGGLKGTYPFSFDFELFFNLRKLGKIQYVPAIQGYFRWHKDSMSVEQRRIAVRHSSQIRKNFLPKSLRRISMLWEPFIITATMLIAILLNNKIKDNQ